MDKEFAPLFTFSPEFTKEFKRFKLTSKCPECGAFNWTMKVVDYDGNKINTGWRLRRDSYLECRHCQHRFPICNTSPIPKRNAQNVAKTTTQNFAGEPIVKISLSPEKRRVKAASEVINIPQGVTITVKRSRVIEHTVDISWQFLSGGEVKVGLQAIIAAAVRGEVGKTQGRVYQESESIEYEIELSGKINSRYTLEWTDIWLVGNTEIHKNSTTNILPFQFLEYSELEVKPS